jgi:hypothetical protein
MSLGPVVENQFGSAVSGDEVGDRTPEEPPSTEKE